MKRFFSLRVILVLSVIWSGLTLQPLCAQSETHKIHTVVLDAGHGGDDPGCSGKNVKEKDIALDIVLRVGKYIQENIPDVKVIYTRDKDVFIPLHERAAIANRNDADLFISIHCNANNSSKPYGTETFVMGLHVSNANLKVAKRENNVIVLEDNYNENYDGFNPASPTAHIIFTLFQNAFLDQSIGMASKIEDQMEHRVGRHSRGVKQAGFLVLYKTAMPSVLIETGFLSNPTEEKYLNSEEGKTFISSAIFRAFRDYKVEMDARYAAGNSRPPKAEAPHKEATATTDPALPAEQSENNNSQTIPSNKSIGQASEPQADHEATPDEKHIGTNTDNAVLYRVQFYASSITYKATDPIFSELSGNNILRLKENNIYKYLVGDFDTATEATELKNQISGKGFSDAFVVAYRQGERISMQEARKSH